MPELEEFRRELLEKARAFYLTFTREKPDSLTVREEMARAHFRLGDIDRILVRRRHTGIRGGHQRIYGSLEEILQFQLSPGAGQFL